MKALALIAAFACSGAMAEVVAEAKFPNGATIQLHREAGDCVNNARKATWIGADGTKVPGCHKIDTENMLVSIAWFDAEGTALSARVFKVPEGI